MEFFKNLKVGQKMYLLLAFMVVSLFVIGLVYGFGLEVQKTAKLEDQRISKSHEAIDDAQIALLQARRSEKDFLLRNDAKYLDSNAKAVQAFYEKINALENLIPQENAEEHQLLKTLQETATAYETSFNGVAELKKKLGLDEESGLRGKLRNAVHSIEGELNKYNETNLLVSMLMMRRHEKDFLLRGHKKYIKEMAEEQEKFTKLLMK